MVCSGEMVTEPATDGFRLSIPVLPVVANPGLTVKSKSSRLKSDRGSGREMEVSHRGGPEV